MMTEIICLKVDKHSWLHFKNLSNWYPIMAGLAKISVILGGLAWGNRMVLGVRCTQLALAFLESFWPSLILLLLQHHSSKASILRCSAFFIAQLSHPYMTTGKTIALTRQTFVSNVMSLLFNMLSRFVIAFLPSSKHLLISPHCLCSVKKNDVC